jgi:hypothetical protein
MLSYSKNLKEYSRALRRNMTNAERSLWSKLKGKQLKGLQFNRQKPIGNYIDVLELEDFVYRSPYTEDKLERLTYALGAIPYSLPSQRRRILDFAPYALIYISRSLLNLNRAGQLGKRGAG